jgi:hypothetical protein
VAKLYIFLPVKDITGALRVMMDDASLQNETYNKLLPLCAELATMQVGSAAGYALRFHFIAYSSPSHNLGTRAE